MTTYKHKGVTISLDEKVGDFTATIAGKYCRAPSLPAMQKRIDKNTVSAFVPFNTLLLDEDGWGDDRHWKMTRERVTGIRVYNRKSKHSDQELGYAIEGSLGTRKSVILDIPENRALIAQLIKHHTESKLITTRREKEADALDAKLKRCECSQEVK